MNLRKDARFAAALEECCRRVRDGEDLEACLGDYPAAYREELGRLVPLSSRLSELGRAPTRAFQARLEERLLAAVRKKQEEQSDGFLGRFGRVFGKAPALSGAIIALVVLLAVAGGGVGVVQAADDSLPDSPLYQVKKAREWVQVALARDDQARVGVGASLIAQRGREVDQAVRARKGRAVVEALARRLAQPTRRMVDLALALKARGNPQPAARALAAIRTMQRQLDRLEAQAAPDVRPVLERMRVFLEQQEQRLAAGTT